MDSQSSSKRNKWLIALSCLVWTIFIFILGYEIKVKMWLTSGLFKNEKFNKIKNTFSQVDDFLTSKVSVPDFEKVEVCEIRMPMNADNCEPAQELKKLRKRGAPNQKLFQYQHKLTKIKIVGFETLPLVLYTLPLTPKNRFYKIIDRIL